MNVLRITGNFFHEQRWMLLAVSIYAVAMSCFVLFFGGRAKPEEALYFMRQQAMLAVFFAATFAGAALHSDLRTRRIMGILSKAVHRYEYLLAIALGCWTIATIYIAISMAAIRLSAGAALPMHDILRTSLNALELSLLGVSAVLCFVAIVPPLFATALAALALFGPALLANSNVVPAVAPAYTLASAILTGSSEPLSTSVVGIIHAALWFAIAVTIFNRRDIALPVD